MGKLLFEGYFFVNVGVDYCHGGEVYDVAYRGVDAGEVDWLVQADLDWAHDFGCAHFKEHLEHGVGSTQVREYERVHIFTHELVEWELLVAQLLVEGVLHLHFAFHQYFGIVAVQDVDGVVDFDRAVFGV